MKPYFIICLNLSKAFENFLTESKWELIVDNHTPTFFSILQPWVGTEATGFVNDSFHLKPFDLKIS